MTCSSSTAYTRAVRAQSLKYIEGSDHRPNERFDLEDGPGETIHRVGNPGHREQRLALRGRMQAFFHRAGAPPLAEWRSTTRQEIPTDVGNYR